MKIHDDHLFHGAALIQIAEHPNFTAINSLKLGGEVVRVAYKINNDIAVYFKYASKKPNKFQENIFTFHKDHLDEIASICAVNSKCFVALVCVEDREICCLPYAKLQSLLQARNTALMKLGRTESALTVLVTAKKNKALHVYVNQPGKKGVYADEEVVARNAFPAAIFE